MTANIDKSNMIFHNKYTINTSCSPDSLINFAHQYLKTPYRLGACGTKAFDCSGFAGFVYKYFGYYLERTAAAQAAQNGMEINRTELKPGDLVFFKGKNAKQDRVRHVGIVVDADNEGNFSFIHASIKLGVTVTESKKPYYDTRYITAKRIIPEEDTPPLEISPLKTQVPPLIIH